MIQIMRREFVRSLGALTGAALLPRTAGAQEPGRIYRLGDLHLSARNAPWNGQNLLIDEQGFGLNVAQLPEHAAAVVKTNIDVIIAGGDPNVRAAQQATKEIAILGIAEDMVGSRFVASLAKPGGNTTGVSLLSSELDGKRQEILMEALPGARRYAALADVNSSSPQRLNALQEITRARGAELSIYRVTKSEDFSGAIETAKNSGAAALNVLASTLLFNNRQAILARTAALGLPAIYQWPTVPAEGGLIGYGPRLEQIYGNICSRQRGEVAPRRKSGRYPG